MMGALCVLFVLCCWFAINVVLDGMDIIEDEISNYGDDY